MAFHGRNVVDQHALELHYFLEEAQITPTDLFAAMADDRYHRSLLSGVRAVVNDYKERGRNPPPVILRGDQNARGQPVTGMVFLQPQHRPGISTNAVSPSNVVLTETNRGERVSSSALSAARQPRLMENDSPRIDPNGSDTSSRRTVNPHVLAYAPTGTISSPIEYVPGTAIRISSLTAPQSCETINFPMSFVARIIDHKQTKQGDPLVMLDFGNGERCFTDHRQGRPSRSFLHYAVPLHGGKLGSRPRGD